MGAVSWNHAVEARSARFSHGWHPSLAPRVPAARRNVLRTSAVSQFMMSARYHARRARTLRK